MLKSSKTKINHAYKIENNETFRKGKKILQHQMKRIWDLGSNHLIYGDRIKFKVKKNLKKTGAELMVSTFTEKAIAHNEKNNITNEIRRKKRLQFLKSGK